MREAAVPRPRIAVTGLGVICALGRNQREFWSGLVEGRCAIGALDLFEAAGCLSDRAAQAPLSESRGAARGDRRLSRTDRLCLIAAEEALRQAGLAGDGAAQDAAAAFGVSIGSSTAGMLEAEDYVRAGIAGGFDRAAPSGVLRLPTSCPSDALARRIGAGGPRLSNMTACASSALSIGFAADAIRAGDAPGMIAGGGDALCLLTYAGFNALRLLDPLPCRPFDRSRQGLSLGEGAGILVLEAWEHAAARGARVLAELLDYGASCDAHHMTAPHPEGRGAGAALSEALRRAGLPADGVGHVNAHGTGTTMNDLSEAQGLRLALGEMAARVPVTAPKGALGHLLGGAGAVEAVALVLSLLHQVVPPTAGHSLTDPAIGLDVVSGRPRVVAFEHALTNSFGFGGSNATLAFRRVA